jgi:hypothetical protein
MKALVIRKTNRKQKNLVHSFTKEAGLQRNKGMIKVIVSLRVAAPVSDGTHIAVLQEDLYKTPFHPCVDLQFNVSSSDQPLPIPTADYAESIILHKLTRKTPTSKMSSFQGPIPTRCTLCSTPWSEQQGWSWIIEKPVLAACGSILGEACMNSLFHSETINTSGTERRRCKHCDQPLWYSKCGHSIRLHPVRIGGNKVESVDGKKLPLVTSTAEPESCEECAMAALPNNERLKVLGSNFKHFQRHLEQRVLTQVQVDQVAEEVADYEAEIERVEIGAEVELRGLKATRRGW